MPLDLRAHYTFFAQQDLAAFVSVPLGSSAGVKMDASSAHADVAFQARRRSREVFRRGAGLLRECDRRQGKQESVTAHYLASESTPKANKTLPPIPPRAG